MYYDNILPPTPPTSTLFPTHSVLFLPFHNDLFEGKSVILLSHLGLRMPPSLIHCTLTSCESPCYHYLLPKEASLMKVERCTNSGTLSH